MKRECAYCDGMALPIREKTIHEFRGEEFEIFRHYYKCNKCQEQFTDAHTDDINVNQVYNAYRERHKILFPEQIKELRESYGLTQKELTDFFGFGINMISKYEMGEIPSKSNATLLSLLKQPDLFLGVIKEKRDLFENEQEYDSLIRKLETKICTGRELLYFPPVMFGFGNSPNEYTGYQIPKEKKFSHLALFFVAQLSPSRLQLTKLLFYSDFLHFKLTGKSISGSSYRSISLGPVPHNYDMLLGMMCENDMMDEIIKIKHDPLPRFVSQQNCDIDLFSESEHFSMDTVLKRFGSMSAFDIIDISHSEKCWIETNKEKSLISYRKYAFELNGIPEEEDNGLQRATMR